MADMSVLPASGFTVTNEALHRAAKTIICNAKKCFEGRLINAHLWAYRHEGNDFLCCDLIDQLDNRIAMPLSITTGLPSDFKYWDAPVVVDMVEALHLAGLVTTALNANVFVGRQQNELNEELLASPLTQGKTNGKIDLS